MKLLDIMKKYDRCLVRESAKLTKIYNMILKESELAKEDDLAEEACPDCGNDPCTCDVDECGDGEDGSGMIPEEDFFNEACKDGECCDEKEEEEKDADMIPESEFIRDVDEDDMLRNRPYNNHINDPRGVIAENDESDDDDESNADNDPPISAKEFFAEAEKENAAEDVNEEVEMMSAEEFFKNASPAKPEAKKDSKAADMNEDSVEIEPDCKMVDVRELLAEKDNDEECNENDKDEKNLEESLKSYRRKNHHLFNG